MARITSCGGEKVHAGISCWVGYVDILVMRLGHCSLCCASGYSSGCSEATLRCYTEPQLVLTSETCVRLFAYITIQIVTRTLSTKKNSHCLQTTLIRNGRIGPNPNARPTDHPPYYPTSGSVRGPPLSHHHYHPCHRPTSSSGFSKLLKNFAAPCTSSSLVCSQG
jgi:hypothetical protein